ncbi:hypothetical protein SK128_013753 [Halocaridina rubra]|uniref:GHMP kinase N-terminal domain-containing protein n=1 Tax=Halocaridina rubra TaxID=373956 RepID=A0AAN8WBL9_HALRR
MARLQIWKGLQGLKATFYTLDGVTHHYLSSDLPYKTSMLPLLPSPHQSKMDYIDIFHMGINVFVEGTVNDPQGKLRILDSWIGKGVELNCTETCVLSGFFIPNSKVSFTVNGEYVWLSYPYKESNVVTCYGMDDSIALQWYENGATIFNSEYQNFLQRTGLCSDDLWPEMPRDCQTFVNAKLFLPDSSVVEQITFMNLMITALANNDSQKKWLSGAQYWKNSRRLSLFEIVENCDVMAVMKQRDLIHLRTIRRLVQETADEQILKNLRLSVKFAGEANFVDDILSTLHQELQILRASTSRLLANVADLLGCMAAGKGGLRSGPASNPQWKNALVQLKAGYQKAAVEQMFSMCKLWIGSHYPEDLVRAARHYERASQIIISRQVETAENNVKIPWRALELHQQVKCGEWVEAHCPARIDLAGGWSDTPPICYEQGGAVLNIAIKINKQKPIGARARFIQDLHISCTLRDWSGGDLSLIWTELKDLRDYDNPVAPGALVKAVLLYCHTVELSSEESLATQLKHRYGGGLQIEVWSKLPQGSGLGGSSLLAGTLVAVLAVLYGHPPPDLSSLIHATLVIEQWLTTGGGWQDQIGGLVGGAKLGISKKGTPVTVSTYEIPLSENFVSLLNEHLLLLYTGKVRLARNLLQTVIRNWYARDKAIIECFSKLQMLGVNAAKAMLDEDIEQLGSYINDYWSLKKIVASGCEPLRVTNLMASLRSDCFGMSLAGAGGGGYFYAFKKCSGSLPEHVDLGKLNCDVAELDEKGLEIWRNGESVPQVAVNSQVMTKDVCDKLQESVMVPL